MKKILLVTTILYSLTAIYAQSADYLSYEAALDQAKVEDKILVLQFAGSDWCAPCIRFELEILGKPEFQTYKEKFVWLKADFPRKKNNRLSKEQQAHNDALAEKYNLKGAFPLLVFIDGNEKIIGTMGYRPTSATEYIVLVENVIKP